MENRELQENALAISDIIAQSGVSSEEFQKADSEISKAFMKQNFSGDDFLKTVKEFFLDCGIRLTDMTINVYPKPAESEYGFMKYVYGARQLVITGEMDWIDK